MIAILSPAKTLDYAAPLPDLTATTPRFEPDADVIAKGAARLGARRLGELMRISDKLAKLNAERFRGFADAEARPALFAFAGDVYTGFEARTLESEAIDFAQRHVRILSGIYGLLRPLDAMKPYRLEMGTRWAPGRAADLYVYWKSRIADALAADLAMEGSNIVVNLASQEYWHAVAGKLDPAVDVIEIEFREPGPDGPRFVSFNAKRARGIMARWICEHRITDLDGLKAFDSAGYAFDPAQSDAARLRFTRA